MGRRRRARRGRQAAGVALAFARRLIAEKAPLKKVRDRSDKLEPARGDPEIFEAIRKANARKFRGFEAWGKAIESVRNAVDLPFDEGIVKEREMFMALLGTTQSKAQRHVFFAERQAAKIADVGPDEPTDPIRSVGVIGAGTMGGGIAMNFLAAGIPVTIVETSRERARPRRLASCAAITRTPPRGAA